MVVAGILFFFRLGTPGLFDADEPAYAQAAREMVRSGDWITPRFNGQPRFDKPILFYWLIALAYRTFGVGEFAVRFWSAAAALALVSVIVLVARRRFGAPAGVWAGLTLATSLLTALLARAAVTDMLLTLFVTGAILAANEAVAAPEGRSRGWALVAWGSAALAVLVKGPVGVLIPVMALAPALWLRGEFRGAARRLLDWRGPVLFLALAAPWYVLVLAANGRAFIDGFVLKHHVTRYVGVVSSHAGPLWFYLPVVLIGFFPWSAFLPRAGWRLWHAIRNRGEKSASDLLLVVCGCWALGLVLFFSLAGTKLPSYIYPAFPALALLVGYDLACPSPSPSPRTARRGDQPGTPDLQRAGRGGQEAPPRWTEAVIPWLFGVTGAVMALAAIVLPLVLDRLRPLARGVLDGVEVPAIVPALIAGTLLAGVALALRLRGSARYLALGGMMAALVLIAEIAVAPRVYAIVQGPLRDFSDTGRRMLTPGAPLVVYGLNAPTIVFYVDRPVIPLPASPAAPETLDRLVARHGEAVVITRAALVPQLVATTGFRVVGVRGGYALLARRGADHAELPGAPSPKAP